MRGAFHLQNVNGLKKEKGEFRLQSASKLSKLNSVTTRAKTLIAAMLIGTLLPVAALAQIDSTAVPADSATADTSHFQWWSAVPVLGYTEETELQYGAMVNFFIPSSFKGGNSQEIDIAAYGSTRKQFQFAATPYFYPSVYNRGQVVCKF